MEVVKMEVADYRKMNTIERGEWNIKQADAIAAALGDGWSRKPHDHDDKDYRNANWQRLAKRMPDGRELLLSINYSWHSNNAKLDIRGEYPCAANGKEPSVLNYQETAPTIGAGALKSPEQIAVDIKRRLLPEVEALYARYLVRIAQQDEFHAEKLHAAKTLSKALGCDKLNHEDSERDHVIHAISINDVIDGYGDFTVSGGNSIKLEIRSMNLATALKFAEVIKTLGKQK
jgi:hypothetical protein